MQLFDPVRTPFFQEQDLCGSAVQLDGIEMLLKCNLDHPFAWSRFEAVDHW